MPEEHADAEQPSAGQVARALMHVLASTRTAVVLLLVIALASIVGTILQDPTAQNYVYGRLWFHLLLGLLGLNLLACMIWRKRVGMARIWSLLTHTGIFLVLVGAIVTLVLAERGVIIVREGQELSVFVPEKRVRNSHRPPFDTLRTGALSPSKGRPKPEPLGFTLRLVEFRITYYPTVDYVYVMRRGHSPIKLKVRSGEPLDMPGTGWRLSEVAFMPKGDDSFVEVTMPHDKTRIVPAKVGTTQDMDDKKLAVKILRYEPSFKIDVKTKKVTSDSFKPVNPALQVALVRGGKEKPPRWLFAKMPDFGRARHGSKEPEKTKLRFLHPGSPALVAVVEPPSGSPLQRLPIRLAQGKGVPSPWDPSVVLAYRRVADRAKEYESEVEVLEEGRVVRRHVIRVNSPLVYKGTKLSQVGYDQKWLRWTRLGVSRDKGVWFVYAGFLATMAGLMGTFYLRPVLRRMRAKSTREGGGDGSS